MKTGTISSNKKMLKKLFINAFFVMCFLEIMHSAASIIDSFFIGNYIGSMGMAAMGFARPYFSFVDILCGPLGLGMQLMCSQYIGKTDFDHAQKVFSGALTIGLIASMILAAFGILFSENIVAIYGTGENVAEVIPLAKSYINALFIGAPAMVIFGILSPIVQLGSEKKRISIGVLIQVIADVTGDVLSIFVFHGGIFGLGLATALSYYFSLIPLVTYFFQENAILKLGFSFLSRSDLKDICNSGLSKSIKRVCNTIKPLILNGLSILLGTSLALSAYSITTQLRDLLISFSAGASGAVVLIGALLYSQQDRDGLRCIANFAGKAIVYITALGVVCFAFAQPIAEFFITDSAVVIDMAVTSIRCVGIMIPFATFNGIFISCMQITRQFGTVNFLSYMNRLVLIVVTSATLGFFFGVSGLWWAIPVSEIINAAISLCVVKVKTGMFPRTLRDLLCLKSDFGYKPEDYIEVSMNSVEDVSALLDSVSEFCKNHEIDSKRAFFTQIALEELAMNVITHGFAKSELKDPSIYVRITYDEGNIHLRFQDNCPSFNVMKYCAGLQKANPERNVGLRLVSKISKEMSYVNLLNTNNLVITI